MAPAATVTLIAIGVTLMILTRKQITIYADAIVDKLALAIAKAEGYFPGSLAWRSNNPGNIKDSSGKQIYFATVEEGWSALKRQVSLMLTGASRYYKPEMSIAQIAPIYTGGDKPEAWSTIVASELGVSKNTTLLELLA